MSRLLKILAVAVVLFFVYLWGSIFIESCNQNKEPSIFEEVEADTPSEDDIFNADELTEEGASDDEVVEESEDPIDYDELDEAIEDANNAEQIDETQESEGYSSSTSDTYDNSYESSSTGKYLLICGSFLIKENAEKMKSKLSGLGYSNSEIVVFDYSQYHSVSAGRYDDYDTALKQVDALKRQGIDAYVHTRK